MIKVLCVFFYETLISDKCSHKYFSMDQSREAINLAKKMSKLSGKSSKIFDCEGFYDGDRFCETKSTLKSVYTDGIRQKL